MNKPLTSADFDNDWPKERAFMELGAERMLRPAPHHPLYFPELTPKQNAAEQLRGIAKDNVRASDERLNYHE
jgi:transposase